MVKPLLAFERFTMTGLEPSRQLQRSRLSDQVASRIRDEILTGRLRTDAHISQVEWAERLGVSRMPIRDAINQLVAEGVLLQTKNGIATVAPLNTADVHDGYYLTAVLCSMTAKHAASRITQEELEQLDRLHEVMVQCDPNDRARLSELNWQFHAQINKAAHAPRLLALLRTVSTSIPNSAFLRVEDWPAHALQQHGEILVALREQDPARVSDLMFKHIQQGSVSMLSEIDERLGLPS
jgi:DNA-binding GntR family transcriptional regulator